MSNVTLYTHSCGSNKRKYYLYHPGPDQKRGLDDSVYFPLTPEQASALKQQGILPTLTEVEPISLTRCECPQSSCTLIPVSGYDPASTHPNYAEKQAPVKHTQGTPEQVDVWGEPTKTGQTGGATKGRTTKNASK
jgi:hypothetical protein